MSTEWVEPLDPDNPAHWDAADRHFQAQFGWLGHPIYVNGDYPELMKGLCFCIGGFVNIFLFLYVRN